MGIFEQKMLSPMLIGVEQAPFDSLDYIYELKLDGVRCLAYLDKNGVDLRNKRNLRVTTIYPELSSIHKQVKKRCILDGELIAMKNGKPAFSEMQRRALLSAPFKIQLASKTLPVSFTTFDILYYEDNATMSLPLLERKALLAKVITESERLAVSRYIERDGIKLYQLAETNNLEGIVSKRKDSLYYHDKRTKDWTKSKNLLDDDFLICGYILKEQGIVSLVLGEYDGNILKYAGHVTMGISREDFQKIKAVPKQLHSPFLKTPKGNDNATWIQPELVGTVKYMEKTISGSMRQPVFKGLRDDMTPSNLKTR